MMQRITLACLMAVVPLVGCGVDELGVRSVSFDLHAMPAAEAPAGIDAATLLAMMGAMGEVNADVAADDLHVAVSGLPALPAGFSYAAMGSFAEHEREAMPGSDDAAEGGHSHGAVVVAGADPLASEGHALATVLLGPLAKDPESEEWSRELTSAELDEVEMGALRGAMIMLVPEAGDAVVIMSGEVGHDEAAAGTADEGGHSHGP